MILIVQNEGFDLLTLVKSLMIAAGGQANKSYFYLLNLPISEAIYHLDIFKDVQVIMNPEAKKKTPEGKLSTWGLTLEDFE